MSTKILIALTAALAGLLGLASAVGAGAPPPARELTVDPTTFAPGATLTYAGTGCADPDSGDGTGMTVLVLAPGLAAVTGSDPAGERIGLLTVAADGSWSGSYTVPAAGDLGLGGDRTTELLAECYRNTGGPERVFAYDPVTLTIDLPDQPTTTTAPSPAPAPAPAAPVHGAASYTG